MNDYLGNKLPINNCKNTITESEEISNVINVMSALFDEFLMAKHGITLSKFEKRELNDYRENNLPMKNCKHTTTALAEIFFKFRDKPDDYLNVDSQAFNLLKRNNFSLNDIPETLHDFISTKPAGYIFNLKSRGLDINRFCYLRNSEKLEVHDLKRFYDLNVAENKTHFNKNFILEDIDLNIIDSSGNNILFYGCSDEKIDRILRKNININQVNNSGMNALFNCNAVTAKKLITHGIDIFKTDILKRNALFYCGRDLEKAELLLDNGMNINQKDLLGRTPLFYAESKDVLNLYLNEGADRYQTDNRGKTAFQFITEKIMEDKKSLYNNIGIEFLSNLEKEEILTNSGVLDRNEESEDNEYNLKKRRL